MLEFVLVVDGVSMERFLEMVLIPILSNVMKIRNGFSVSYHERIYSERMRMSIARSL